jgi:hypothetical protein
MIQQANKCAPDAPIITPEDAVGSPHVALRLRRGMTGRIQRSGGNLNV